MSRSNRALGRRYARALLEVVAPDGRDSALALRAELQAFAGQLEGHAELQRALAHPGVRAEQKQRLAAKLAEAARAGPLLRRLVELLGARDRLALLGEVAEAYAELANAAHGVVAAEAVSAVPLTAAQKQALEAALKGGSASVELKTTVEPAIVGGLVVRALGRTYDGSVRAQLEALRRRLAAAG